MKNNSTLRTFLKKSKQFLEKGMLLNFIAVIITAALAIWDVNFNFLYLLWSMGFLTILLLLYLVVEIFLENNKSMKKQSIKQATKEIISIFLSSAIYVSGFVAMITAFRCLYDIVFNPLPSDWDLPFYECIYPIHQSLFWKSWLILGIGLFLRKIMFSAEATTDDFQQ